ncbi:hypothetical protein P280DRAFT_474601 [Massarina eburnea CBS 473.64]|uniref:Uncharacterized protein n=1 Tax=Massarina eburnea CBS 473.64 TaxID=1395130 RepID=A0A6A6RHN5_9PLEO|nr:hypothetical protein P280DRAFT_474601 [Massarina eburnea CBS 473.64]
MKRSNALVTSVQRLPASCNHGSNKYYPLIPPLGIDIVDMLMDETIVVHPMRPTHTHRRGVQGYQRNMNAMTRPTWSIRMNSVPTREVVELVTAQRDLAFLYSAERGMLLLSSSNDLTQDYNVLAKRRAVAERRYVNAIICYYRSRKQMSNLQAAELQGYFTHQKMTGMGFVNREYLLGLFRKYWCMGLVRISTDLLLPSPRAVLRLSAHGVGCGF